MLRKDVGGWSRKWQFSLTLGRWVVQKILKTPLPNIPNNDNLKSEVKMHQPTLCSTGSSSLEFIFPQITRTKSALSKKIDIVPVHNEAKAFIDLNFKRSNTD